MNAKEKNTFYIGSGMTILLKQNTFEMEVRMYKLIAIAGHAHNVYRERV